MSKRVRLAALAAAVAAVVPLAPGCGRGAASSVRRVTALAAGAGTGACAVSQAAGGSKAAVVLVFEEQHLSRAGQIEQAIALVGLYHERGLRDIVMEGYVKDSAGSGAGRLESATAGLDEGTRAALAVRFLEEGEIGGAEFLSLVRPDVRLHAGESAEEYAPELDPAAAAAPLVYLHAIGASSLPKPERERLERRLAESSGLPADGQQQVFAEISSALLAGEKWARGAAARVREGSPAAVLPAEQAAATSEEILKRAAKLGLVFPEFQRRAMERNLRFWRARGAASKTLARSAGEAAVRTGANAVALVIGAAHTAGVTAALKADSRPFAVLTPLSLKNGDRRGDLTWQMLERKYEGRSVLSGSPASALSDAMVPAGRKPQPAVFGAAFQARAESAALPLRLAQRAAAATSGGAISFAPADLNGTLVAADAGTLRVQADPGAPGGRAVVCRLSVRSPDGENNRTVWVKAAVETSAAGSGERAALEAALRRALLEVQSATQGQPRGEGASFVMRLAGGAAVAFGASEAEVGSAVLAP